MPTPWAPSQHKDMNCACRHWDALDCARARLCPYGSGEGLHIDDRCDCRCHDHDEDEDYDTDDARYWTG